MRKIAGDLGSPAIAEEILSLWMEYEEGSSAEAAVARQLDKLEMIVQADEYERAQNTRLDSFFDSTKDAFSHPEVVLGWYFSAVTVICRFLQILAWAEELRSRRRQRLGL